MTCEARIGLIGQLWTSGRAVVGITAILLCLAVPAGAASGANAPLVQPFYISGISPSLMPRHPIARAEKLFPFSKHRPFSTAGFNPLFLPFHHAFSSPSHGLNRAQAFAFLFSSDLDWATGNYCARHAYFVFTRSGPAPYFLLKHYTPANIALYFRGWRATIGIGGTLKHTAAGYTADIVLFNRAGKLIHTLRYSKPMSYWNLLGTAEAGVMAYLGEPPTPALAKFLRRPRCTNMQGVTDLGKAAFLPTQSHRAFALFRKVLQLDPDFADARYWYDIQRSWRWTTGNDQLQLEIARCLKARIGPYDSQQFDPLQCSNPQNIRALTAMEPELLIQLTKLTGADSSAVIYHELEWRQNTPIALPALLHRAKQLAAQYPNNYYLLIRLGQRYGERNPEICFQPDLEGAIGVVALRDRFLTGMEQKRVAHILLAFAAYNTGHFGIAAALLLNSHSSNRLTAAIWSLIQSGQFRLITRLWPMIVRDRPDVVTDIAPIYAFAAAMCSDRYDLDQIIKQYPEVLRHDHVFDVMQYCSERLAGKNTSHFVFSSTVPTWQWFRIHLYVMAECDLARHHPKLEHAMYQHLLYHPMDYLAWFYLDAYYRRQAHPPQDAPNFYNSLAWIWSDMPSAKLAVADYSARTAAHSTTLADPDQLLNIFAPLKKYRHSKFADAAFTQAVRQLPLRKTTIFDEIAAIHQLVQRSEFAKALRLAHLIWWHAYVTYSPGQAEFDRHVIYMVKLAQMEAHAETRPAAR